MREKNAGIELQRVSVEDFKSLVPEARTQKLCKSRIFFDRQNVRAFFKKKPGQRAQAGPDLDDVIFRSDFRLIDDPASEILVVQKVLTESFDRRDADFFQRRAYVRKLHRRGAWGTGQQGKFVRLFTKFCEQNASRQRTCSQVIHAHFYGAERNESDACNRRRRVPLFMRWQRVTRPLFSAL